MTKRCKKQQPDRGMVLKEIEPMTFSQQVTFDYFHEGYNLFLHGCPGTGKSFLSLYLALNQLYTDDTCHAITVVRSAQPTKQIGFLPGTQDEKMADYEKPYQQMLSELFGRGDAYSILKTKNLVNFESTSFLRGTTFNNTTLIIDEAQNMSYMELKTVLTRIGNNCRVIICGDLFQDDLTSKRYNEISGLRDTIDILNKMDSVMKVEFGIEDIVRSGFVKEFIEAENSLYKNRGMRLVS